MRHPIQMAVQRLFKSLGPVTHYQLGRLFRDPLGVEGPYKCTPGGRIFFHGKLPGQNLPMPIVPEAQGRQHDPFLFVFHRPAPPAAVSFPLASGYGQLEPQTVDQHNRRWGLQPGCFKGVRPLLKPQHQPIKAPVITPRRHSGTWLLADRADYGPNRNGEVVGPEMAPNSARSAQLSANREAHCPDAAWARAD